MCHLLGCLWTTLACLGPGGGTPGLRFAERAVVPRNPWVQIPSREARETKATQNMCRSWGQIAGPTCSRGQAPLMTSEFPPESGRGQPLLNTSDLGNAERVVLHWNDFFLKKKTLVHHYLIIQEWAMRGLSNDAVLPFPSAPIQGSHC